MKRHRSRPRVICQKERRGGEGWEDWGGGGRGGLGEGGGGRGDGGREMNGPCHMWPGA
jgi:hypothetical protein